MPPAPLTPAETFELACLQRAALCIQRGPFPSQRAELDELRRARDAELRGARALTPEYLYNGDPHDPLAELLWRRPFVRRLVASRPPPPPLPYPPPYAPEAYAPNPYAPAPVIVSRPPPPSPPRFQPPAGTGSRAVPAAPEPVPRGPGTARLPVPPRLGTTPGTTPGTRSRRDLVIAAVRSSPGPLSANAIAATIGGRKANVLHLVRQLVSEGVLVATSDGFTLP